MPDRKKTYYLLQQSFETEISLALDNTSPEIQSIIGKVIESLGDLLETKITTEEEKGDDSRRNA